MKWVIKVCVFALCAITSPMVVAESIVAENNCRVLVSSTQDEQHVVLKFQQQTIEKAIRYPSKVTIAKHNRSGKRSPISRELDVALFNTASPANVSELAKGIISAHPDMALNQYRSAWLSTIFMDNTRLPPVTLRLIHKEKQHDTLLTFDYRPCPEILRQKLMPLILPQ